MVGIAEPREVAARRTRPQNQAQIEASLAARAAHDADRTLRTRFPIVNLRIESELLMFIAQTGLNLQQAHTLRVEQFHYTSHIDGYQVRTYKIDGKEKCYSRSLPVIESGSSAISNGVPNGFPMSRMVCSFRLYVAGTNPRRGDAVHERYAHLPRAWHTDSETAKTARDAHQLVASGVPESPTGCGVGPAYGANADTRICRPPHPQIAMVEITRFHQQTDPSLSPPAPGRCVSATPEPVGTMPKNGPRPDCINAAGCLFCTQHRDIESEDHVVSR